MNFKKGLQKIVNVFEEEQISYMIVGGFAMSYYNRFRFTANIDCVIQIHPHHVDNIVKYFPDWAPMADGFKERAEKGQMFNITDFETGLKYDFMPYKDNDYNYTAFERKKQVDFMGISCFISTPEDLIISKLKWFSLSQSNKQLEDIQYLLNEDNLDFQYLELWTSRLNILKYGLF